MKRLQLQTNVSLIILTYSNQHGNRNRRSIMVGRNPDSPRVIREDREWERVAELLADDLGREPTEDEIGQWMDDNPDPPDADAEPDDYPW